MEIQDRFVEFVEFVLTKALQHLMNFVGLDLHDTGWRLSGQPVNLRGFFDSNALPRHRYGDFSPCHGFGTQEISWNSFFFGNIFYFGFV